MLAGMILKQGKKAEFVAIKVSWRQHSLKCEFVFVFPREEEQRPCDVTYSICSSACMSAGVIGRHRHDTNADDIGRHQKYIDIQNC